MVLSAPEAHQGHLQPRHVGLHLRGAHLPGNSSTSFRLLTPLLLWHLASSSWTLLGSEHP